MSLYTLYLRGTPDGTVNPRLPAGLTFDAATRTLSGAPTEAQGPREYEYVAVTFREVQRPFPRTTVSQTQRQFFSIAVVQQPVDDVAVDVTPDSLSTEATATVTVRIEDADDNGITGLAGNLDATVTGSATLGAFTDAGDGSYTATLANTVAEDVTVSVDLDVSAGVWDGDTATANVSFTNDAAPAPSLDNSTVTATGPVAADGVAESRVTVTLRDDNDNQLSGGGATVTVTAGAATVSAVTDNDDGTYTATVTHGTAEAVTVRASLDGGSTFLTNTADVRFVPLLTFAEEQDDLGFTVGSPVDVTLPGVTGGAGGAISYTLAGRGLLPAGLVWDPATRSITGTPTAVTAGSNWILTATESGGSRQTASQTFPIAVVAASPAPDGRLCRDDGDGGRGCGHGRDCD